MYADGSSGLLASVRAFLAHPRKLERSGRRTGHIGATAAPNHQKEPTRSQAPVEYGIPVLFVLTVLYGTIWLDETGTYWWSHARFRRQLKETALRLLDRWMSLRMGVVPFAISAIAQPADNEAAPLWVLLPPLRK